MKPVRQCAIAKKDGTRCTNPSRYAVEIPGMGDLGVYGTASTCGLPTHVSLLKETFGASAMQALDPNSTGYRYLDGSDGLDTQEEW